MSRSERVGPPEPSVPPHFPISNAGRERLALEQRFELDRPMFSFDPELRLLEQSLYGHVLELIDFDGLYLLEQELASELDRMAAFGDHAVLDVASALIARAMSRAGYDERRFVSMPLDADAPGPPPRDEACPFCRAELRACEELAARVARHEPEITTSCPEVNSEHGGEIATGRRRVAGSHLTS